MDMLTKDTTGVRHSEDIEMVHFALIYNSVQLQLP